MEARKAFRASSGPWFSDFNQLFLSMLLDQGPRKGELGRSSFKDPKKITLFVKAHRPRRTAHPQFRDSHSNVKLPIVGLEPSLLNTKAHHGFGAS